MPTSSRSTATNHETHLFIIWENARSREADILNDIREKFSILRVYEITWSKDKFSENLSRFYGTNLPPNSNKEHHCGTGPFLAVVVEDTDPNYEVHTTTKGDQRVNTKLFTSKSLHREWTGGGHRVHGTNSVVEADHNLTMLFGKNSHDLRKEIGTKKSDIPILLAKDLEGANGWKNLKHLFYVLNATISYVALRNFESFPDNYYAKDHGDIDLLVENYRDAHFIANASAVFKAKHRVHNTVRIADEDVRFDFRSVGDGYYDGAWETTILENRVLSKKGFYVPSDEDHFYSLLYHALVQKPAIADDYAKKVYDAAKTFGVSLGTKALERQKAIHVLSDFLVQKEYTFTQPRDKSVYFNTETIRQGKAFGVRLKKDRITPLRNHLKTAKSRFKHYSVKSKKIVRHRLKKFTSNGK